MQSNSSSLAPRNLGCSQLRFSSRSSFVSVGKNCSASKNGPSCSTMRWIVTLPISIAVDKVNLLLGGVDSKDSLLGANQIQRCFWGGSLGCDGTVGFERRSVGADSTADHRPA